MFLLKCWTSVCVSEKYITARKLQIIYLHANYSNYTDINKQGTRVCVIEINIYSNL